MTRWGKKPARFHPFVGVDLVWLTLACQLLGDSVTKEKKKLARLSVREQKPARLDPLKKLVKFAKDVIIDDSSMKERDKRQIELGKF